MCEQLAQSRYKWCRTAGSGTCDLTTRLKSWSLHRQSARHNRGQHWPVKQKQNVYSNYNIHRNSSRARHETAKHEIHNLQYRVFTAYLITMHIAADILPEILIKAIVKAETVLTRDVRLFNWAETIQNTWTQIHMRQNNTSMYRRSQGVHWVYWHPPLRELNFLA